MSDPVIRADHIDISKDVSFGDDVVIEAETIQIGAGVRIGFSGDDDFRTPPGVRIRVNRLVLDDGVSIGGGVRMAGGKVHLGPNVAVQRMSTIDVADWLTIGEGGIVGEQNEIIGRKIEIGQELWTGPHARIGGGSAFENTSSLSAGHYLHLGLDTFVNTARPVVIGHEVGLGTRTSIYTHGAYPSRLQGFPVSFDGVTIGDFTWAPGAVINPGVRIGRNCVIGVNSLVSSDIPDGSLAAGSPAKVIREDAYPRPLAGESQLAFFESFLSTYAGLLDDSADPRRVRGGVELATASATYFMGPAGDHPAPSDEVRWLAVGDGWGEASLLPGWTVFDTSRRRIAGQSDATSTRFANELRRYGIRFYSRPAGSSYRDWDVAVPESGVPNSSAAPTASSPVK